MSGLEQSGIGCSGSRFRKVLWPTADFSPTCRPGLVLGVLLTKRRPHQHSCHEPLQEPRGLTHDCTANPTACSVAGEAGSPAIELLMASLGVVRQPAVATVRRGQIDCRTTCRTGRCLTCVMITFVSAPLTGALASRRVSARARCRTSPHRASLSSVHCRGTGRAHRAPSHRSGGRARSSPRSPCAASSA